MHPATRDVLEWFKYEHLPHGKPRAVSRMCSSLATNMVVELDDTLAGAELTTGLRKLLEAKDCFVRAALKLPSEVNARAADDIREYTGG